MIQPTTISFLKKLAKNNNKPWFDVNKAAYQDARADFAAFIDQLIAVHGKSDPQIAHLTAKDCMFRINRDIRFSKDKSPYKKNFAASINRGGKKSVYAGYYFHLEPGNSFTGGGIWMPMPAETQKIRQEIDYCWADFKKIIGTPKFKSTYGDLTTDEPGITLSNVPRGYEKDNPAAAYLKLKSWIAMQPVTDAELTSKDLVKKITKTFAVIQPLLYFINGAVGDGD
ncbi:MAG: DUF2461 domain-containing protein [Chitinophagaceae bacterium]|nr:DUF2461 domain-containing protein [Chitinophagaceae bacterium]MCW5929791.1 DUF2461 domain-containing protein [Chitinophagaceae bacterium]